MSNYNPVYNHIWFSNKFNKLDVDGKLVFLYLLTNCKATQTGVYNIMLRQIACDTGLPIDTVTQTINAMQAIGMVKYWEEDNLIFIFKNFLFAKGTIKNPKKLLATIQRQKELILNKEVWEMFDNLYKQELKDLIDKVLISNQTNKNNSNDVDNNGSIDTDAYITHNIRKQRKENKQ